MTSLREADLTQAAQMYAVANTPLFFVRKLREDPVVHEIGKSFSGQQILDELRRTVESEPENIRDYVRPYVYLTALSFQSDDTFLKDAAYAPNTEKWDWFDYLRRVLLETYTPTGNQSFRVQANLESHSAVTHSDASVDRTVITLS